MSRSSFNRSMSTNALSLISMSNLVDRADRVKHWFTYPMTDLPVQARVRRPRRHHSRRTGCEAAASTDRFHRSPRAVAQVAHRRGHDALDPFVALAFVAAVTDRLP